MIDICDLTWLVCRDISQNEIGGLLPNFSMLLRLKDLYVYFSFPIIT